MRIPSIFRNIPNSLRIAEAPATIDELNAARNARQPYLMESWPDPYMVDMVRAFRILDGANIYVEVGTRDKGNLAWVAPRLAQHAAIVDVDIESFPEQESRLRVTLNHNNEYHCITGDSIADSTLSRVRSALAGREADAIFCDSSHMYEHTLAEFERYFPLVRPGGMLMYHDCYWEGNAQEKGKAQALQQIDRFHPVYVIFMDEPVHRFLPRSTKGDTWGAVALIIKE